MFKPGGGAHVCSPNVPPGARRPTPPDNQVELVGFPPPCTQLLQKGYPPLFTATPFSRFDFSPEENVSDVGEGRSVGWGWARAPHAPAPGGR